MTTESAKVDNVNEDPFKSELDMHKRLISAAIKRYGCETLVEDKSLELITAMVYKKINIFLGNSKLDDTESGGSSFSSMFGTVMNIIGVIASVFFIYSILKPQEKGEGTPGAAQTTGQSHKITLGQSAETTGNKKPEDENSAFTISSKNRSVYIKPFEFKKASEVLLEHYCGREDKLRDFTKLIKNYLRQLRTMSKKELDKISAFTKVNFALLGPPGTGKTLFVHYIATVIDRYLKEEYLKNSHANVYENLRKNRDKLEYYMDNHMESRLLFCEVSSGIINNVYFGQSEKNINTLFEAAKKLTEGKDAFEAVFIFFDEGEVFFGERVADSSNQTTANVKSELLQRIGVRPTSEYVPVFVFCATNKFNTFDSAFKRRFGNQAKLDIPNEEERDKYVRFVFKEFDLKENEIRLIVSLTRGRSQSFIPKYAQEYYIEDESGRVIGLELKKFLVFLYKNKDNKDLV